MRLNFLVVLLCPLVGACLASLLVAQRQHNWRLALAQASIAGGLAAICVAVMFMLAAVMLLPPPNPSGGNPWGSGMSDAKVAMVISGVYAFLGTAVGLVVGLGMTAIRYHVFKR